jgi:hypothetical protein
MGQNNRLHRIILVTKASAMHVFEAMKRVDLSRLSAFGLDETARKLI